MAKVCVVADTHFGIRNDSPVFHEYHKRSLNFLFDELDKRKIRSLIHVGDLFDRRKYVNFITAKLCREQFLERLDKRKIDTHIIVGNHDVYYKNTNKFNSLDEIVTNSYDYITTHTDATSVDVDGLEILLVPWICEENAQETYDKIKHTKAQVLMGHLELSGFEIFRGIMSEHGDDRKIYKKFDQVYSGHYHHKSSSDNIHYLGAFAEYTWADYDDPRGFSIYDTQTRKIEFIRNPYSVFKIIEYDDSDSTKIMDIVQSIKYEDYSGCYVKIICKKRENPYAFDVLLDRLNKVSPADISVVDESDILASYDLTDEEINDAQDTASVLGSYIDGLTLPVDSVKMKSYMKDIYQEAVSLKDIE